jgi:non-ribosomal peptide synthetase component F
VAAGGGVSSSELAQPTPGCAAVAREQQEWLRGPSAEQEARWWVDRLRHARAWPRELGTRPADPGPLHRRVTPLPAELTAQLTSLARRAKVSLFATLLTGFAVLLQRWTGCADTAIGTLVANRPNAGSARVMGAHYNAVLIDTDLSGDPSLAQCLLDVSARTVAALDHQSLPLPVLTERLARECGWDATRTPGVMFLMDRYPMEGLRLAGCQVTGVYVDSGNGPVDVLPVEVCADVIFFVREAGERLTLSVFHRPGLLPAARVTELMRAYLEILSVACESPETPLSELPGPFDGSEPAPDPVADASAIPTLRRVTDLAPVDALSPVAGRE